ncbi:M1 family metallopeptidase [Flavobacterium sp. NRK1]|uniref:M1 family metallopeptidase n=1 Tax=Flavobacterium sp. NRK1 TaxID=2954929 RepID=UPI0020921945|nr:M1 family metallopeptidase [Flavobacterium sp. NRK1]MCO6147610.1 M1 family metallopeptidase [Flavobacterium sp. NRK1]
MKKLVLLALLSATGLYAQNNPNPGYWQQHVDYKMNVSMDVKTYRYTGKQELVYTNNSKDTLNRVFYHLYNNAFQPGSDMDARLKAIADPDRRMVKTFKTADKTTYESRISNLKPDEIGYLKVENLKQDGAATQNKLAGTILEVTLAKPLLPGQSTTLTMDFEGQVPVQIRRSGRNNAEGVALSMTQWYPKMAEYDFEGWHTNPYIAREFHGVWGNFDVNITIDKDYTIGGTGYLQNKNEIGKGYQDEGVEVKYPRKTKTLTWHFVAPNVHDFAWAADSNFAHDKIMGENNTELHFFYKNTPENQDGWKRLQPKTAEILSYYNKIVGKYPYKQYSVIQGGDGGMEYAMCTLITGHTYEGLVSVTAHEFGHSWFQHVLASNETEHGWMDEGFTTYIEDLAMHNLMPAKDKNEQEANPFAGSYANYFYMVKTGKEQPLSTQADRFDLNMLYSISSYSKGSIFLSQLGYLIGEDKLAETIKRYYADYKFTHPTPNDIKRTAEKVTGAQLGWYLTDWTETTNTIDYSLKADEDGDATKVTLERIGRMPMPIDIIAVYEDGTQETFYVPLRSMRYIKDNPYPSLKRTVLADWDWAYPTYNFTINKPKKAIKVLMIDPSELMADVNRDNNVYIAQ